MSRKRVQASRSRRQTGCILDFREKIVMSQKETFYGTVKNHHFDMLVRFDRCDGFVELWNRVRAKDVEGRVIDRHTPVGGRLSSQENLFSRRRRIAHLLVPKLTQRLNALPGFIVGGLVDTAYLPSNQLFFPATSLLLERRIGGRVHKIAIDMVG